MRFHQRVYIPRKAILHPITWLTSLNQHSCVKPICSLKDLVTFLKSCTSGKSHFINVCKIHARMVVLGHGSDMFPNNMLLNAYSRFHCLQEAHLLFDGLIEKNLISWSILISMYSKHGCWQETLNLFTKFRRSSGNSPNNFILSSILSSSVQFPSIYYAQEVHCYVLKLGLSMDVYVGTALLNLYLKIGLVNSGNLLFEELPVKNLITWTTMISGSSHNGNNEFAFHVFTQMMEIGIHADCYLMGSIISVCSALSFFEGGRQIHCRAYRTGIELDISLSNVLIDFYSKCGQVKIAKRLFDALLDKNIVSWTTMIAGYMKNSYDFEALWLFRHMFHLGWQPDAFACTSILISCAALMDLQQGKQAHAYIIKSNLVVDEYVSNGLVDMYAKCCFLVDARAVFNSMQTHDLVSYNTLIEGYAQQNELGECIYLFHMMRCHSLLPSQLTFVSILGVSASQGSLVVSKQIHGVIMKGGLSLDLYCINSLINAYTRCLCIEEARTVFEEMTDPDVAVWNAMIRGYTQNGEGEKAIQLYRDLCLEGIEPDNFTFVPLVTAAKSFLTLSQGCQFHAHSIKAGLVHDPFLSNALADFYAKYGSIMETKELFDPLHASDVVCWNSLISRFAEDGHAEEALILFRQMQDKGVRPNHVTFLGVLSACSHAGLVEDGLFHFNSMSIFDIEPWLEHYASLVHLLGKAGQLKEAKEFIERMPIEPSVIVWRSLLAACKEFGDVVLGKYAAEMAITLDPMDSGAYILLSNIFASKKMWTDVEKVRKEMDFCGVVKESGCSWIEVDGKVHAFVSKDMCHPESKSIYFALDKLAKLTKDTFHNCYTITMVCENDL